MSMTRWFHAYVGDEVTARRKAKERGRAMSIDREALIAKVMNDLCYTMNAGTYRVVTDHVLAALPVVAKAITDEVRSLHEPHKCGAPFGGVDACFITFPGACSRIGTCSTCWCEPTPCPTVRLLDEIDAALGVER